MVLEIFKAVLAGILAALPVGPVLLLIISNTTSNGKSAGALCALGCVLLDTFLAAISLLAMGYIEGFISQNENLLMIIGGGLLIVIGLSTIHAKVNETSKEIKGSGLFLNCTVKTFLTGLSNPAAFAVMFALLASLGFGSSLVSIPMWGIIFGVAVGEILYWSLIVFFILQRFNLSLKVKKIINYVAGSGIIVFGIILILRLILK